MNPQPESLLSGLAAINSQLIQLETECRGLVTAGTTTRGCDIREYQGKIVFEGYVEVESGEIAVCWWIDLTFSGGGWMLDRSLLRTDRHGQQGIRSFESRAVATGGDLGTRLTELTRELTHREAPAAILQETFAGS